MSAAAGSGSGPGGDAAGASGPGAPREPSGGDRSRGEEGAADRSRRRPPEPLGVLHVDAGREWRGGQNQLRLLARELSSSPAVEQAVAARRGSRVLREAEEAGVEAVALPWGPALDPRAVAGLAREAAGRDLVHAHSSHALQASVAALALAGAPARLVAARRLDFPVRSAGVWRRADLVLAVSRAARRVLVGCGVEPSRVRVVHDGIDPGELRPQRPGRLREAAGAPPEAPLVGAVGALVGHKDHATFVRTAARVARRRPDVHFLVAGEGPERDRLERLRARAGLEGRLHLPGHVPGAARSLADLDVFVMSSREEGLGTAALEALAAGVPVALTRAGGLADVAGEALPSAPPEAPAELAREVLRLLDDDAARREAVEAGRRRLRGFTAGAMASATLRAYRDVVVWARRRRRHARRLEREAAFRRARTP